MSRSKRPGILAGFALGICVYVAANPTHALAAGTITGSVVDAKTKKPLGYANIVIVGTPFGAMSLDDGVFRLIVEPGVYAVKCMMMGYKTIELRGVVIDDERTATLRFLMEETIVITVPDIVVVGEREMIDVKSTGTGGGVTGREVESMPGGSYEEVLGLTAGVTMYGGEIRPRNARGGEVLTLVGGVQSNDPLGGGKVTVGLLGLESSEIITGGMDAEYGNAQSGIINVATKEGGDTFHGEFRYTTDDFGRADKTYTNYDRIAVGFGGPAWGKSVRFYVSGEATFSDGEYPTVEPRDEHKVDVLGLELFKARERMNHVWNGQAKLTWHRPTFKINGEFITQGARFEEYAHNWNVKGYTQKVYYFQRLQKVAPGIYTFGNFSVQYEGPWLDQIRNNDPAAGGSFDPDKPHPRSVKVEQYVRNPVTNERDTIEYNNFRAVELADGTVLLWDEALVDAGGNITAYKPWVLFEGFQTPYGGFSNLQDDSSYVFFNSATRTPQTRTDNYHVKLGFNHNVTDDLLYTLNLSRLEFNRLRSVDGKEPHEYATAGQPTVLPDGTVLENGVSDPVWYTDPDNPYFVTAYDYPRYTMRKTVQWLAKTDVTSQQVPGHTIRAGLQFIYNDLYQDDRIQPGIQRRNPVEGTVQQGQNVNLLDNRNYEGAVYLQDKWEYEGMVVNAGLRWEFFTTGNATIEINSAEIEPDVERFKYNWSPRLGVSFPITARDKFFFHYARYTQWPNKAYLFATQDAVGSFGTLGNPNLGEELTVSYHAGIGHQFTKDIAGSFAVYSKDIFGLVDAARVTDDSTGIRSFRFVNKAYASARGLEVTLEQRLTRRVGFKLNYTYSFADGVASDADFGRNADGLTHLPTDETALDWDQRHTFNFVLQLENRNEWGATAIYQYGSGLPWTPVDRFARLGDPTLENTNRFDATHRLRVQGRKRFSIYGRELTLFFEGFNLLDQDILRPLGEAPNVFPPMTGAGMDDGAYLTETGRTGGAYLQDIDDDGINDFVPVGDPSVFEAHRSWRVGFGYEF